MSDEGRELEQRMVVEYGVTLDEVWLPLAMLRRLRTHGPWDAPFTEANADQERVLLAHGLAERHNRSGLHRGIGLSGFLDAIPFEPTVSFGKITGDQAGPPPRAPLTPGHHVRQWPRAYAGDVGPGIPGRSALTCPPRCE